MANKKDREKKKVVRARRGIMGIVLAFVFLAVIFIFLLIPISYLLTAGSVRVQHASSKLLEENVVNDTSLPLEVRESANTTIHVAEQNTKVLEGFVKWLPIIALGVLVLFFFIASRQEVEHTLR